MSHFSLLVIGDNVEEQLKPFWELDLYPHEMRECEYAVFKDCTEEVLAKWEEDKKGYENFKQFAEDYHGYTEEPPGSGKFGYWHNPNAKWDWYVIGGRWSNMLRMKPVGSSESAYPPNPIRGQAGVFGKPTEDAPDRCDACIAGQLDLEKMEAESIAEFGETWEKASKIFATHGEPPSWSAMRKELEEKFPVADMPEDESAKETWDKARSAELDNIRSIYNNHPCIKALRNANLEPFGSDTREHYCLDTPNPKEAFLEKGRCAAFVTFAVLKDGVWYERGKMGWWGMVTDESLEYDWSTKFYELITDLPPDTMLTVVDCHI
jgi:hypothetical protein